ncbi:MAG: hypothetical protein QHH10_01245 [Peptococcaceae bacterium]|nr:hypothetical protein [Peptococcaceae bacterium]MDH7523921.1 hypothetical protein [Peptococcaceae bacterium]
MKLWEIAHARAGDKGNAANISLIPYDEADYELLAKTVTPAVVKEHFGPMVKGRITRYELPNICAFNFVLEDSLAGGVTSSLALDTHGKSLSSALLEIEIDYPGRRCMV